MRSNRDAYKNAIDRVRSEHRDNVAPARETVECPRCRTRQVISDVPGQRVCTKCGFEFRPRPQTGPIDRYGAPPR